MRRTVARRGMSLFGAILVASGLFFAGAASPILPVASADITLPGNPKAVRVGHLSSDPMPGRNDYVVLIGDTGGGPILRAYLPGNATPLFSISPGTTQLPMTQLYDVVDLNGDGNAEIIGFTPGNSATGALAALWIYNGNGQLISGYQYPTGMDLSAAYIKIYDVIGTSPQQKRIAVCPNTFPGFNNTSSNGSVYFYNSNGSPMTTVTVEGSGVAPNREVTTFPGLVAGAINGVSTSIFVVVKSRILAFSQDGLKIYYKQFVDSTKTSDDIGYAAENDVNSTPAPPSTFGGRRYGIYKLADATGDGKLDLIVAADANPTVPSTNPGAVYEVYDLPLNGFDGYLGATWSLYLPRTTVSYSPSGYPGGGSGETAFYPIGVPMNGINDINGDGIPDIVVTENPTSGPPVVKIINTRTHAITTTPIQGICLDTRPLKSTGTFRDLIVYTKSTNQHSIWRIQTQGTYTLTKLGESPAGTLSSGAAILARKVFPQENLPPQDTGVDTLTGHFEVESSKSGGVRSIVGFDSQTCPTGLRSWTASGTTVQRSLDMVTRPGTIVNVLNVNSGNDFVWIFEVENTCGDDTRTIATFVQSGTTLVRNGDL